MVSAVPVHVQYTTDVVCLFCLRVWFVSLSQRAPWALLIASSEASYS